MLWQKGWQRKLQLLEDKKRWDRAIRLMRQVINHEPNNKEAYLRMLYLLMNLRVEEPHNKNKNPYYEKLMLKYFKESYAKFHNDPEYLFYAGSIIIISVWFFDIEKPEAKAMIRKAIELDPNNLLYKWDLFPAIITHVTPEMKKYADLVLQNESPLQKMLKTKGSLGDYFIDIMTHWSKEVLEKSKNA